MAGVRLDRWLWAARFFKTRRLAVEAIQGGKVHVDGARAKPGREVREGDRLRITKGRFEFEVVVRGLAERRGPASEAEALYEESEASRERRAEVAAERRAARQAMPHLDRRPDKHTRRRLAALKRGR